jgi:hypothetical protein
MGPGPAACPPKCFRRSAGIVGTPDERRPRAFARGASRPAASLARPAGRPSHTRERLVDRQPCGPNGLRTHVESRARRPSAPPRSCQGRLGLRCQAPACRERRGDDHRGPLGDRRHSMRTAPRGAPALCNAHAGVRRAPSLICSRRSTNWLASGSSGAHEPRRAGHRLRAEQRSRRRSRACLGGRHDARCLAERRRRGPVGETWFPPRLEAGGRFRTYDLDAGSAALCQLSYTREHPHRSVVLAARL